MRYFLLTFCLFTPLLCGCEMLQWASPHQLWKLNRQPAGGRSDPYFSIPADPASDGESAEVREE